MIISARIVDVERASDASHLAVSVNIFASDGSANFGPQAIDIDVTEASMTAAILAAVVSFWNAAMPTQITGTDVQLSGVFNT